MLFLTVSCVYTSNNHSWGSATFDGYDDGTSFFSLTHSIHSFTWMDQNREIKTKKVKATSIFGRLDVLMIINFYIVHLIYE